MNIPVSPIFNQYRVASSAFPDSPVSQQDLLSSSPSSPAGDTALQQIPSISKFLRTHDSIVSQSIPTYQLDSDSGN